MLFQREERCVFLVINLVKLYLSAKRLIDCIYELIISITIAENVISFSSQFAIASIASRLLRFRLRLRNYRLPYTWHVIFSFSFFRCLEADEATRNAGFSSVRKERVARYGGGGGGETRAGKGPILVARGKILRKIVGETIRRCFANYVASSCPGQGWQGEDSMRGAMSAYSANGRALCHLTPSRVSVYTRPSPSPYPPPPHSGV